ncbi:MAG: helix-hairpin-helix domain-containing protein, partial [Verrucomicrobiota bacterium]|nr:helix-hairpin-helix domain-containing protein [Verrucomicrobiota bacterium]
LTGWEIDIEAEEIEIVTFDEQVAQAIAGLAAVPGIGEDLAKVLVTSGFLTVEDLKQASVEDLSGIPGLAEHAQAIYEAVQNAGATVESPAVEGPNEAAAGSESAAQEDAAAVKEPAAEDEPVVEEEPVTEESPEESVPEAEDTPSGEPEPAEESKK